MAQKSVCKVLGCWLKKSQAVSWADAAWGISLSGLGFTEWIKSGNKIASWIKKTGILFPTISGAGYVRLRFSPTRRFDMYNTRTYQSFLHRCIISSRNRGHPEPCLRFPYFLQQ